MSDLPATTSGAVPATYDREKLQLIRDMFAKGASDNEFGVMVEAEALLGKAALDDCCEVEVKETGVTVEYERPEGSE